jgi:putative tryptophan/tyrosine transport system substrate-binding protein
MMKRLLRVFGALVCALAVASPGGGPVALARAASTQRLPTVGFLSPYSRAGSAGLSAPFRAGLAEAGYVDGQNVTIIERYADGQPDRLPGLAAELVALPVDVLLSAGGRPSHVAAKQATTSIPIVVCDADPVLAAELNAGTGGNVTGALFWSAELADQRLARLQATVPGLKRVAVLRDPSVPNTLVRLDAVRAVADERGVEVVPVEAQDAEQLAAALDAASRARADALLVLATPLFTDTRDRMAELTAARRLPTMYESGENAGPGGLMWYGQDVPDDFRRAGGYVARLLNGAKPSELPWLEPERFDFVVNLDAARALGLAIPPAVLARATELLGQPTPAQLPPRT